MTAWATLALAGLAGVGAHLAYFHRGEHHLCGVRYLQLFVVVCLTAVAVQVRAGGASVSEAGNLTASLAAAWLAGVFGSLTVYRVLLHPLNKFPGPLSARLTAFWYSSKVAGHAQAHRVMLELHQKHGDFVRIGPNDLSIAHPEGPKVVYGPGSRCTKAAWYDNDAPFISMHTSRNRAMHDRRRRVWSPAFSDKALRGYEERIKPYGRQLVEQLSAFGGKPVNVSDWFNYFSFDVMGDLAFGESFDMLRNGEAHWAIRLLNEGMEPLHLMLPPWMFKVLTAIPGLAAGYWKFIGYCSGQLDRRIARGQAGEQDIMSSLLEPYAKTSPPAGDELMYLQGDSRLIIVAGSDTTAATLTHLFFHVARQPEVQARLRDELAAHVDAAGEVDHKLIVDAPYLNGCIYEALRINPPVPTMVARLTPPDGITVGDTFVPGNMAVWCPQYVLGRSEKVYPQAHAFVPERWYSKPEMVTEKTAWAPFSSGVYGCIGRPLAMLEIRTLVAKLVTAFDIGLATGEQGQALQAKTRDHFTLGLGDLYLTFEKRRV